MTINFEINIFLCNILGCYTKTDLQKAAKKGFDVGMCTTMNMMMGLPESLSLKICNCSIAILYDKYENGPDDATMKDIANATKKCAEKILDIEESKEEKPKFKEKGDMVKNKDK